MRISYWSSDVCSSDLVADRLDEAGVRLRVLVGAGGARQLAGREVDVVVALTRAVDAVGPVQPGVEPLRRVRRAHLACQHIAHLVVVGAGVLLGRSEEHTSELQSLMRISYAVFCLKKKNTIMHTNTTRIEQSDHAHLN